MKVFLSHAAKDRPFLTDVLVPFLHQHGIETWFCEHDIPAASYWEDHILDALKSCDWFIVVLTATSVRSEWVRAESHWAFERMKGKVVPILLEDCDIADMHLRLMLLQCVDFRTDHAAGGARLLRVFRENRGLVEDDDECVATLTSALPTVVAAAPYQATVVFRAERCVLAGQEFRIEVNREATLGRQRGACDLRIPDAQVSRVHARISVRPGEEPSEIWVEDAGSANGTFVNGVRLRAPHPLQDNDLVSMGEVHLRYSRE